MVDAAATADCGPPAGKRRKRKHAIGSIPSLGLVDAAATADCGGPPAVKCRKQNILTGPSLALLKKFNLSESDLAPGPATMCDTRAWVITALENNFNVKINRATMEFRKPTTEFDNARWHRFLDFINCGIASRNFFAGMHCFGYATLELMTTLDAMGVVGDPDRSGVRFLETCDIALSCQSVLLRYPESVRGHCITRDIAEQLPIAIRSELNNLQWPDDAKADVVLQAQNEMRAIYTAPLNLSFMGTPCTVVSQF